MESKLRNDLLACADAFVRARGMSLSTLGRMAAGDWRFFVALRGPSQPTFTARKYDSVMDWFCGNWPDAVDWPADVARPQLGFSEAGEATHD